MDQHPVPRQITTFEFKLIGFMTLKQFIYLVVFVPLGFIVYSLFPVPFLNVLVGLMVAAFGFALAFVPVYDRPLDIWIKNFIKRLTSPTQYLYHKQNKPPSYFQNLYFASDPHITLAHVESQDKLNQYLAKTAGSDSLQKTQAQGRQRINQALHEPPQQAQPAPATVSQASDSLPPATAQPQSYKEPTLTGVVKSNKKMPLPGVLIYIKDQRNIPIRLLKTNPHGVFATYSNLNPGEYIFEIKDPKGSFLFDTMKINIEQDSKTPLEFYSKELI